MQHKASFKASHPICECAFLIISTIFAEKITLLFIYEKIQLLIFLWINFHNFFVSLDLHILPLNEILHCHSYSASSLRLELSDGSKFLNLSRTVDLIWVRRYSPLISSIKRKRHEDLCEFVASLVYTVRPKSFRINWHIFMKVHAHILIEIVWHMYNVGEDHILCWFFWLMMLTCLAIYFIMLHFLH